VAVVARPEDVARRAILTALDGARLAGGHDSVAGGARLGALDASLLRGEPSLLARRQVALVPALIDPSGLMMAPSNRPRILRERGKGDAEAGEDGEENDDASCV
jgi:hypothetical protein